LTSAYIDTSAAAKLLVLEPDSDAMATWVQQAADTCTDLVSSLLLETELRRFALRHGIEQSSASEVLGGIALAELPPSLFLEAGLFSETTLRTLDALHLASAIRLEVDELITYDVRLADAARALGLRVTAPQD
jgi:predicted nucleic acid-binding protein